MNLLDDLRRMVSFGPINPDGSYQDEWLCSHGVGHPKDTKTHHGGGIHGCDGCCAPVYVDDPTIKEGTEPKSEK